LAARIVIMASSSGGEVVHLDRSSPEPPVRFETVLLSHADRSRMFVPAGERRPVPTDGVPYGSALHDGVVHAIWRIVHAPNVATMELRAVARLSATRRSLAEEGERMLRFAAAEAPAHDVRFTRA
jgi:hypothetical protein